MQVLDYGSWAKQEQEEFGGVFKENKGVGGGGEDEICRKLGVVLEQRR